MNQQPTQSLAAALVPDCQRLDFLPDCFGQRLVMRGEALLYAWMCRLCEQYGGAYWNFYRLSDGGFYFAPKLEDLEIAVDGNGFQGKMSADAAGIVATLFTLSQLASETVGTGVAEHFIESYHSFDAEHAEAIAIFSAID